MTLATQFIIITVAIAILFFVIGIVVGYWICKEDQEKTKAKVMNMTDHELFMKRHGLK